MSVTAARYFEAQRIVKNNAGWSVVAGLAPLPFLDLAAITAVQVRMLKQMSDLYGIPFRKELAKSLIGAAIGGSTAFVVAAPVASMLKAVPGIGTFISTLVSPAAAATTTYALGKVFIQHFEAGGTLLDMDPATLRAHYYEEFNRRKAETEAGAADAPQENPAAS